MRLLKLLEGLYEELKTYNERVAKEEEKKRRPIIRFETIGELNDFFSSSRKKGGAA